MPLLSNFGRAKAKQTGRKTDSKAGQLLCVGGMCMDVTNDTKIVSCTMILHGLV